MKNFGISLLALSLIVIGSATLETARSEQLTPFVGETAAEFEARKSGKARPETNTGSAAAKLAADRSGHFLVVSTIEGVGVRTLIDTGASIVALRQEDANRIGIHLEKSRFTNKISTANGIVLGAPIMLKEITIGDISIQNVAAVVMPDQGLQISLLGMSFLSRLSRYEMSGDKLVIER